ncbi:MAG: nuclear transport factor 2 family protein [Actinobacteria bacterium]|nr:nuclear transport factor 2 family protein [Actinomycetota bacterium]
MSSTLKTQDTEEWRRVMNNQIEELNRLVEDWATAEQRGDTAFLESTLADDFVGVGPRGFTLTKEQWLARHEAGNLKYESLGLDEIEVRPYGDAAVTVCRQTAEGVYEDENGRYDIHEQFRATLIFVKQRERWLLAGLQLSPILGRP